MKKVFLSISIILTAFLSFASAKPADKNPNSIIGFYWSPKKDAKIEVYRRGDLYYGKFIWLAQPRKDHKNPKKQLQDRDVLGLELLTGFTYDDGTYEGGDIYDPETGKTYSCKMTFDGNRLKVRGFIGFSLFGRTEYFERIK